MTGTNWLAFIPRDTVFVRDGRSFNAAADALAQTVRPGPTTIAGAVGEAFGQNPLEVRGPVLARLAGEDWEPYFPVPADLVVTADRASRVYRMRPDARGRTDLDSGTDGRSAPLRMLVPPEHAEPVKPAAGEVPGRLLMPGRLLTDYLAGRLPDGNGTPLRNLQLAEPLLPERRVGLRVRAAAPKTDTSTRQYTCAPKMTGPSSPNTPSAGTGTGARKTTFRSAEREG